MLVESEWVNDWWDKLSYTEQVKLVEKYYPYIMGSLDYLAGITESMKLEMYG